MKTSNKNVVRVERIPLELIKGGDNVRHNYTGIEELAAGIKAHGLQQPITVYKTRSGAYEVKLGHRRFLALKLLAEKQPKKYQAIDCIITESDNLLVTQVIENVQRESLPDADLYDALIAMRNKGMSHRQIGTVLGKKESTVKNLFLAVNDIEDTPDLYDLLKSHAGVTFDNSVTLADIMETRSVKDKDERERLLKEKAEGKLTRSQLRESVKDWVKAEKAGQGKNSRPDTAETTERQTRAVHIHADECCQKLTLHLQNATNEDFSAFRNTITAYLQKKEGYHVAG
jgi:ParB family chromosome partitioning protein